MTKKGVGSDSFFFYCYYSCRIYLFDLILYTILTPGWSGSVMCPEFTDLRRENLCGAGSHAVTDHFRYLIFIQKGDVSVISILCSVGAFTQTAGKKYQT